MKTINLKFYLMLLIILMASICFVSTAAFVLYQADKESKQETAIFAVSIEQQLEKQLLFHAGNDSIPYGHFPDFGLWRVSERGIGHCVRFVRPDGDIVKSACRDWNRSERWPRWFETIYQWWLQPGQDMERQVTSNNKSYGSVIVSPNAKMELSRAWEDVKKLMSLSLITIVSLCTLLYFTVEWSLRPAHIIVTGLEKMAQGNLAARLPDFRITEWQRTGLAINQLVVSLEKTLFERKKLAHKLVNVQEQERRYLSRELHDEFGQSLAGLAAVALSIIHTAEKECPGLVPEGKQIGHIVAQMMSLLRHLLIRLRPPDFDQLGLSKSLQCMVAGWNVRSAGKMKFQLEIDGDFDHLPEPIPVNIYRIVQECLTNIAKHSAAKNAKVKLERLCNYDLTGMEDSCEIVSLSIEDDGIGENSESSDTPGMGLLGIRERITAIGGQLTRQPNKPSGLVLRILVPVQTKQP